MRVIPRPHRRAMSWAHNTRQVIGVWGRGVTKEDMEEHPKVRHLHSCSFEDMP